MIEICNRTKRESPLCWNYELLDTLEQVSLDRKVDYKLLLWIMRAESKLWIAFNPVDCWYTNNWAWMKANRTDEKIIPWIIPNAKWCWLYEFETIEENFISLANIISQWYWACLDRENPAWCISPSYVGKYKQHWVDNVNSFCNLN